MVVKSAKIVLKKMFAFVSIAVEMQAMLHMVSFLSDCFVHPMFLFLVTFGEEATKIQK